MNKIAVVMVPKEKAPEKAKEKAPEQKKAETREVKPVEQAKAA